MNEFMLRLFFPFLGGAMAAQRKTTRQQRGRIGIAADDISAWHTFERRSWHFDKRLSLDTIVGILGISVVIGGPFLVWGRAMESRVLALETIAAERLSVEKQKEESQRDRWLATDSRLNKVDENMTKIQVMLAQMQAALDHQSRHDDTRLRDGGR